MTGQLARAGTGALREHLAILIANNLLA